MSYSGSFTKTSSVTTQAITGLGFQASCIIFFSAGDTATGSWQAGLKQMAGFWSPFGGGYSVCAAIQDSVATTNTASARSDWPLAAHAAPATAIVTGRKMAA